MRIMMECIKKANNLGLDEKAGYTLYKQIVEFANIFGEQKAIEYVRNLKFLEV